MNTSAHHQVTQVKAKRRQYDEQFKRDAVARHLAQGLTVFSPSNLVA